MTTAVTHDTSSKPEFNPSGDPHIAAIKETGDNLMQVIINNAKPGPRRSVALRYLETAMMYAVKAVAYPSE